MSQGMFLFSLSNNTPIIHIILQNTIIGQLINYGCSGIGLSMVIGGRLFLGKLESGWINFSLPIISLVHVSQDHQLRILLAMCFMMVIN